MNNKFIKLHLNDDNSVVVLNIENISLITTDKDEDNKYTTVYFHSDYIPCVEVNETPEKIESELNSRNIINTFIKVHDEEDNSIILVKIEDIIKIETSDNNVGKKFSEIFIYNDNIESLICNESVEKIYNMINV